MACELACHHCRQRLLIERPRPGQPIRCARCAQLIPVPWASQASARPSQAASSEVACRPRLRQLVDLRLLSVTAVAALSVVGGLVAGAAWWVRPALPAAVVSLPAPAAVALPLLAMAERPLEQPLPSTPVGLDGLLAPSGEELPVAEPVVATTPVFAARPAELQPAAPPQRRVVRRQEQSETELRRQLQDVPQVRLEPPVSSAASRVTVAGRTTTTNQIFQMSSLFHEWSGTSHVVPSLLAQRTDLQGLPFRMGKDCQLETAHAQRMQELSRQMRSLLSNAAQANGQIDATKFHQLVVAGDEKLDLKDQSAVPCLMQMLQPENPGIRAVLLEQLTAIKRPKASEALAKLALFDLSESVRAQAVQALAERPREEYRHLLLGGLRYPWAAVADHAAEALVALDDKAALPALKQLSQAVDPTVATYDLQHRAWMVPEVVRINHLTNCVMCHAPSHSNSDLVRGRLPSQNEPLPPISEYYSNATGPFVRADITYLRQDFSVVQEVEKPGKWPAQQRFDFLVRQRPEKPEEAYQRVQRTAAGNYPQRQAVLFALQALSK